MRVQAIEDDAWKDKRHGPEDPPPVEGSRTPTTPIPPPPRFPPVEPPASTAAWIRAALGSAEVPAEPGRVTSNGVGVKNETLGKDEGHAKPTSMAIAPDACPAAMEDRARSIACRSPRRTHAEASTSGRLDTHEQCWTRTSRKHLSLNSIVDNSVDAKEHGVKAESTVPALCESCERVPRKGKSAYCKACQHARKAGRVCCGCNKSYEPEDDNMIQCDVCKKWVHNGCCALATEIMSLPPEIREEAHYTCARCDHRAPAREHGQRSNHRQSVRKDGPVASSSVPTVRNSTSMKAPIVSKAEDKAPVSSRVTPAEGPCQICSKHCVNGSPDVIPCSECLKLVHGSCTGLGTRSRPFGADSVGADKYLCPCCTKAMGTLKRKAEKMHDDHFRLQPPSQRLKVHRGKHGHSKNEGGTAKGEITAPALPGTASKKSRKAKAGRSKPVAESKCKICGQIDFSGSSAMIVCNGCRGYVHTSCDEHADFVLKKARMKKKKEVYHCPECIARQKPTLKRKVASNVVGEHAPVPPLKTQKVQKLRHKKLASSNKEGSRDKDGASLKHACGRSHPSQSGPKVAKCSSDAPSKKDIENAEKEMGRMDHRADGAPTLVSSKVAALPCKRMFDLKTVLNLGAPQPPRKPKTRYSTLATLKGMASVKEAKDSWERISAEERQHCEAVEARELHEYDRLHAEYLQEMEEWKQASILTGVFPFTGTNGTLKGGDLLLVLEQALLEYIGKEENHTLSETDAASRSQRTSASTKQLISKPEVHVKASGAPSQKNGASKICKDIPEQIPVSCGQLSGIFLTGSMRVISDGREMSAREFEVLAGLGAAKKWKSSVKTTDGRKVGDLLVRLGLSNPPQQKATKVTPVPLSMIDTGVRFAPPSIYAPWHETSVPSFCPIAAHWAGDRCAVCHEDREYDVDQLVSCDDCRVTVHQSCYGIARAPGPDEGWLCQACIHVRRMGRAARKVEQLLERIYFEPNSKRKFFAEKFMDDGVEASGTTSLSAVDKSWRSLERLSWKRLGSIIDYAAPLLQMVSDDTRNSFANAFKAQAGSILRRPQCCLCPVGGGALKRTEIPGVWAHWSCGMYIAENYIENIARMEPICGIKNIARDRWDLPCTICRKRVGAKIQCASACYTSYHTTCARMSGQRFEARTSNAKDPDAPLRLLSYCRRHGGANPLTATPVRVEKESAHGLGWAAVAEDVGVKLQSMVMEGTKALAGFRSAAGAARCQPVDEEWHRESHGTGIASVSGDKAFWLPKLTLPAPKQVKQKGGSSAKNPRPSRANDTPFKPSNVLPSLPEGVPEVVPVYCLNTAGILLVRACQIKVSGGGIMSPSDFEKLAGAWRAKKWRNSVKVGTFDEKSAAIVGDVHGCLGEDLDPEPSLEGRHILRLYELISSNSVLFSDGPEVSIGDYLGQRGLHAKLQADFKADWVGREYWIMLELGLLEPALGRSSEPLDLDLCADSNAVGQAFDVMTVVRVSLFVLPSSAGDEPLVNVTLAVGSSCHGPEANTAPTSTRLDPEKQLTVHGTDDQENGVALLTHSSPAQEAGATIDRACLSTGQTKDILPNSVSMHGLPDAKEDAHTMLPGAEAGLSTKSNASTVHPESHADVGHVRTSAETALQGKAELGRYLRIYWSEDDEWFIARILTYLDNEKEYQVEYQCDGDVEQLDLSRETFEWLSDPLPGRGMDLVGWRVAVYWCDDDCIYNGIVVDFDETVDMHTVYYDDGDVEQICLGVEVVKFLEKVGVTDEMRIAVERKVRSNQCTQVNDSVDIVCGDKVGKFDAVTHRISCDGQDFSPTDFEAYCGIQGTHGWKYSIKIFSSDGMSCSTLGDWIEQRVFAKRPSDALGARCGFGAKSQGNGLEAQHNGLKGDKPDCKSTVRTTPESVGLHLETVEPRMKEQKQKSGGKRFGKRMYVYALEQLPRGLSCHFPEQLPPSKVWSSEAWTLKCASENLLNDEQTKGEECPNDRRPPPKLVKEKLESLSRTEMCRVAFGKSGIHGWGLIARTPIKKDDMVIEYRGVVIRAVLADLHETRHRRARKDCYLFSVDNRTVVDATDCGSPSRFINHCCNPSLYTRVLEVDNIGRLVFFARRNIKVGEELTFDYRFEKEDEASKIPCYCGAPNCRGTMN
eukprot:scaffold56_cov390-Pavlova_lutheri.AAC.12